MQPLTLAITPPVSSHAPWHLPYPLPRPASTPKPDTMAIFKNHAMRRKANSRKGFRTWHGYCSGCTQRPHPQPMTSKLLPAVQASNPIASTQRPRSPSAGYTMQAAGCAACHSHRRSKYQTPPVSSHAPWPPCALPIASVRLTKPSSRCAEMPSFPRPVTR